MGNYGPDLSHWYHYGAIVVWSHATNAQLLLRQDATSILNWTAYLNAYPKMLSLDEKSVIQHQLLGGMQRLSSRRVAENYEMIVQRVIGQKDKIF